jgi:predicted small lipoprotein YifL
VKILAIAAVLCAVLAGCGKEGAPNPPGPADQVTYPKLYPTH